MNSAWVRQPDTVGLDTLTGISPIECATLIWEFPNHYRLKLMYYDNYPDAGFKALAIVMRFQSTQTYGRWTEEEWRTCDREEFVDMFYTIEAWKAD